MPSEHLRPHKTLRDPVHGDIKLTQLEVAIIDTREFQRLGRVRQLGTTNLVYRGALHTRFDHALGTTYQADRMVNCINANPDSKVIPEDRHILTRLAALLHDITHVPFGHTLEDEASLYPRHDEPENFVELIGPESTIGRIVSEYLGRPELARLVAILTSKDDQIDALREDAVAADIVGNTICADLLDYLKRDTYFTGLSDSYSSRFLDYLFVPPTGADKDRVVVRLHKLNRRVTRPDIPSEILGLLRLRYRLAEVVYYHHNKMCTSAMISSAVQNSQFGTDRASLYERSDDELIYALATSDNPIGSRIAAGLRNRHLYRAAYMVPYVRPTLSDSKHTRINTVVDRFSKAPNAADARRNMERELEHRLSLPGGSVIIYCPDERMQMKIAKARVAWDEGVISTLENAPDETYVQEVKLIQGRHLGLWKFVVYLHPDQWSSQPDVSAECEAEFRLRNELNLAAGQDRERVRRAVERWAARYPENGVTVVERNAIVDLVQVNGEPVADNAIEGALAGLRGAPAVREPLPAVFFADPELEWLAHPDLLAEAPLIGGEDEKLKENLRRHLVDINRQGGLNGVSPDVVADTIGTRFKEVYSLAVASRPTRPVKHAVARAIQNKRASPLRQSRQRSVRSRENRRNGLQTRRGLH